MEADLVKTASTVYRENVDYIKADFAAGVTFRGSAWYKAVVLVAPPP